MRAITRPETLTDIQRAARFFYLQQNAFGGKVDGQTFGTATTAPPGLNLLRLEENLSAAHLRLAGAYIENLPWQKCLEMYDRPHTLFYMDPPYWETEGYGVGFGFEQYEDMAARIRQLQGRAIISLRYDYGLSSLDGSIEKRDIKNRSLLLAAGVKLRLSP